jgi:predicted nuclease of predicted toxin-antitoxin system
LTQPPERRRVLLDENLPIRLKALLHMHDCRTVRELGWRGKKNGELIAIAEAKFDVLLTADRNIPFQQSIARRSLSIIVVAANTLTRLLPLQDRIVSAIDAARPGQFTVLTE